MKSHAQSVRKHIDELAEKDYSKLVEDAIGFVLMFIPNETSYIAAMKQQPDLSRYAYQSFGSTDTHKYSYLLSVKQRLFFHFTTYTTAQELPDPHHKRLVRS